MAIDWDKANVTAEEIFRKQRQNKYRAKRTEYGGVMYDSKAEAEYAERLDRQQFVGVICWWLRQVTIPLGPDFSTRVDFLVADFNGLNRTVYAVEIKGVETREFKRVRKLWPKYGPFPLRIVKKGNVELIGGKT